MQGKTVLWLYEYLKKAGANATLMHLPHEDTNEKLGTDVHFYPLSIAGLNLCNNYTQGYTVGKFIAKN